MNGTNVMGAAAAAAVGGGDASAGGSEISFRLRNFMHLLCLGGHAHFMLANLLRCTPSSRAAHPRRVLIARLAGAAVRNMFSIIQPLNLL